MLDRKKNIRDFVGGSMVFLAGFGVILESIRLRIGTPLNPQPGFFPFLSGVMLMGLSLIQILLAWQGQGKRSEGLGNIRRPACMVVGIMIYVLVLEPLGYVLATIPLTALVLWILGIRSWRTIIFTGLGLSLGTYFVFASLLGIELPHGLLGV